MKTTANDILALLAEKHSGDVFVPECKNGPTHTADHLRMDAWAMRKCWSRPCVTAYEIKVSRSDFTSDDKWTGYLRYCNQFYFACPSGLIKPEELQTEVGLLWVTKNKSRFYTKRKAAHREVVIPDSVFRYILMARVGRHDEWQELSGKSDRSAFWKGWMERKDKDKWLGHAVGRNLRRLVEERIERVERKNYELTAQNKGLQEVKVVLDSLGIIPSQWDGQQGAARQRLLDFLTGIPESLPRALNGVMMQAERMIEEVERVKKVMARLKDE